MKSALTLLIVISFALQVVLAETVTEVTFSGGAPFGQYQPRVIIPLLTEAFKRNGIRFKAKYYPSLRSLVMSNSGKTDGELHRVHSFHKITGGKYANLIRIESKLLSVWLVAFAAKAIKVEKWEDLKGYRVVYRRGRKNMEKQLANLLLPEQVNSVNTEIQAFMMVASDREDIVISELRLGRKLIASTPELSTIKEIARLDEKKIYAYIHKDLKTIALKIAKSLTEMKRDGTFLRIMAQVNKRVQ